MYKKKWKNVEGKSTRKNALLPSRKFWIFNKKTAVYTYRPHINESVPLGHSVGLLLVDISSESDEEGVAEEIGRWS